MKLLKSRFHLGLLAAAIFVVVGNVPAQITLLSSTVDGGGGTCAGGEFSLTGTIGQPDVTATSLAGATFVLDGGFWPGEWVAPAPEEPPTLRIRYEAARVVVSWPASSICFALESAGSMPAVNWNPVSFSVALNGDAWEVVMPPANAAQFFRLRKP